MCTTRAAYALGGEAVERAALPPAAAAAEKAALRLAHWVRPQRNFAQIVLLKHMSTLVSLLECRAFVMF
jgi:hypothetical protein